MVNINDDYKHERTWAGAVKLAQEKVKQGIILSPIVKVFRNDLQEHLVDRELWNEHVKPGKCYPRFLDYHERSLT